MMWPLPLTGGHLGRQGRRCGVFSTRTTRSMMEWRILAGYLARLACMVPCMPAVHDVGWRRNGAFAWLCCCLNKLSAGRHGYPKGVQLVNLFFFFWLYLPPPHEPHRHHGAFRRTLHVCVCVCVCVCVRVCVPCLVSLMHCYFYIHFTEQSFQVIILLCSAQRLIARGEGGDAEKERGGRGGEGRKLTLYTYVCFSLSSEVE